MVLDEICRFHAVTAISPFASVRRGRWLSKAHGSEPGHQAQAHDGGHVTNLELDAAPELTVPFGAYKDRPLHSLAQDGPDGTYLG